MSHANASPFVSSNFELTRVGDMQTPLKEDLQLGLDFPRILGIVGLVMIYQRGKRSSISFAPR